MKRKITKCLCLVVIGFLLLLVIRIGYGYRTHPAQQASVERVAGGGGFQFTGKNYATKAVKGAAPGAGSAVPLQVDQKYEKVGTVTSKSKSFVEDEEKIRAAVKKVEGLIQFEQNSGLEGQRTLHLGIGVVPDRFDELIGELRALGELASIRIDKVDKTNEYKMLQAQRATLEATKTSLLDLKKLGSGSVEELITLEERISEAESKIQDLGVNLGDFDAENEFCTVKCSLLEVQVISTRGIPFSQRVKVAFEWTCLFYSRLAIICIVGTAALWLAVLALIQIRKHGEKLTNILAME